MRSLFVDLGPLWPQMFCIFAFMGTWGGIRRPNGLKVISLHPVLCAINIAKTYEVSTTHNFFCEFVPRSCPKGPQGHLLVPFWIHLLSQCRLFGVPWGSCATPGGPLWIQWNFVWQGAPQESVGSTGGATSGMASKTALGLPRECSHPAKRWYVPQLK